jgi:hypothetical protein
MLAVDLDCQLLSNLTACAFLLHKAPAAPGRGSRSHPPHLPAVSPPAAVVGEGAVGFTRIHPCFSKFEFSEKRRPIGRLVLLFQNGPGLFIPNLVRAGPV